MIGPGSALSAAFESSHSKLFDLSKDAPSIRAMVQYRHAPVTFAVAVLGVPEYRLRWSLNRGYQDWQWDGTPDPIAGMLEGLADEMDVCVEAATGTQKSYTAAIAVLWFLACWEGALVKTYAPSEAQLKAYMWKEIRQLWPRFKLRFPEAVLLDLEIRMRGGMDNSWGAIGVSVKKRAGEESSIAAQGAHSPHMLLIYEEGPGIEGSVYTAGENTCTAPHNLRLAIGNPDNQLDTLHTFGFDSANQPRPHMRCIRVSAHDHPNVVANDAEIVPGAVSKKSVDSRRIKYVTEEVVDGEVLIVEGRLYQSRVRGMSPTEAADALIQLAWIIRAQERYKDPETRQLLQLVGKGRRALGVDASNSKTGDYAAVSYWRGAVLERVPHFPCPNSNDLGFKIHLYMEDHFVDPDNVGVDNVGVGAGTYNELLARDKVCRAISGGEEGGYESESFISRRAEVYWMLREDLRLNRIALPDDAELTRQLTIPLWTTRNSKIVVEPKEKIQERMDGESPNKSDAVAYGNAVRPRDPVAMTKPKMAPTREQKVWQEVHELDMKPHQKKFWGTLRQ